MLTRDFSYRLPRRLIAQYPAEKRDGSRLLYLDRGKKLTDSSFKKLPEYLRPGDLLVLNNTHVLPARLFAKKATGGRVEIMLERILDERNLLVQLRASKSPLPGAALLIDEALSFTVNERRGDMFLLEYTGAEKLADILNRFGRMPLPPYINRHDEGSDKERYQTVFSEIPGAVAAPTAGLHFTEEILTTLKRKNINNVRLTLHIGAGTFQPVRADAISRHQMHSEYMRVTQAVVDKINETKKNGGRVLAVGTTVVRALETAAENGELKPFDGDTDIFIYPGFKFNVVDMLLTNFHLPESTLLMLVCAFAGKDNVMHAYQHALTKKYRFYSYGDAMLLNKNNAV